MRRASHAVLLLVPLVAARGHSPEPRVPDVQGTSSSPATEVAADAARWWTGERGFERLGKPEPGSWRERFPDERDQSYEIYVRSRPVRARPGDVLAFLPCGTFDAEQQKALGAAVEFAGLWFDLPTRVLPAVPVTTSGEHTRQRGGRTQVETAWFLHELLPARLPKDAVALIGITMSDLYPEDSWNFVFGEADLRARVGVYSLARFFPEFEKQERDAASLRLALVRTLKVVVHEAGHTFGLEHCKTWKCTMNGSNSLPESDAQPLHLCPTCLRKLAWNRQLDPKLRYERLAELEAKLGLADEAAWIRARLAEAK